MEPDDFAAKDDLKSPATKENIIIPEEQTCVGGHTPRHANGETDQSIAAATTQLAWFSNRRVYLCFLFVTAVLFAPFFIQGRVLVGNTDNLYTFYPNLVFGHHSFRSGDFGLWNPLLFTGMDASGSMHLHMLNPLNWVLLLAPKSQVLQAITIKALVEISLIGFFVFLTAASLLRERMTAIVCGLALQLSGFVWYTAGMYYSLNMLLATVIYIYLLLTRKRRAMFWNYFWISLCFAAIMFGGNPGYVIAFMAPAPVLALILGRDGADRVRLLGTIALSGITALALAGVRILSVALTIQGTSRAASFMPSPSLDTVPGNSGAFLLPGLVPGVWGLNFGQGSIILNWLKVDPNLQFPPLAHFAVLPLLLVFLGMSGRLGRVAFIASAAAAFLAVTGTGLIPMSYELVWALLRPLHPIVFKVFCALVAAAAVILACRRLERDGLKADLTSIPLALSFVVAAVCFQMWTKCIYNVPLQALEPYRPLLGKALRFLTVGAVLCTISALLVPRKLPLRLLSNVFVGVFVIDAVCVAVFYYRCKLFTTSPLTLQSLVYMTGAVFCGSFTIASLRRWRVQEGDRKAWRLLLPVAAVAVILVSIPLPDYPGNPMESVIFCGAMLSVGRFLALAVLGVELLSIVQRIGWRPILPFLLVFMFADAILLSRAYENFGYKGFDRPENMYVSETSASKNALDTPAGPNLLQNESLRIAPTGVENWTVGGPGGARVQADPLEPGAVILRGIRDSTLFQDVRLPSEAHHIVFGAWVKSKDPRVAIGLTAKQTGAGPTGGPLVHHSGSGQWEWLKLPLDSGTGMWEARPHLFVFDAEGELSAPVLAIGSRVLPRRQPKDVSAAALELASAQGERPDFAQFRVNFPQIRFGYPAELFSNIAMIYGVPSYGGTDSTVNPELERLLTAFVSDPKLVTPYGVQSAITEPRILDLLGVRYDFKSESIRPNALPRISVFSSFQVAAGFDAQLARLKDPSFNYTTTVLVDHAPSGQDVVSGAKERFAPTSYTQVSNSHVHVKTSVSRPTVLLFNDSFSPDWCAYRNGLRIPILRANAHFMAVSLPAGMSEIDFRFEPTRLYLLFKISIATALLLLLAGIWRLIQDARRTGIPE